MSVLDFTRIKNLQEFTIIRDVPRGFVFRGKIPYDLTINDSQIKMKVWAISQEEADIRADQFLESSTEDE